MTGRQMCKPLRYVLMLSTRKRQNDLSYDLSLAGFLRVSSSHIYLKTVLNQLLDLHKSPVDLILFIALFTTCDVGTSKHRASIYSDFQT